MDKSRLGWPIGCLPPIYFNNPRKTITIMHYEEYLTGSPLPIVKVHRDIQDHKWQHKNCHSQNGKSLVKCNCKIHNRDGRCREKIPTSTA